MNHFRWHSKILYRLRASTRSIPSRTSWVWTIVALCVYGVMVVPFGMSIGFLKFQPELNPGQWLNVAVGSFLMPGLSEELMFRTFLIPHPTEPMPPLVRQQWIFGSWVLFILFHLLPWTPSFFHEMPFLWGAGLLGILCTLSYLQSRSMWTAVFIHWAIVVQWLLVWGGLEKFGSSW